MPYGGLAGPLGPHNAVPMARPCQLPLLSTRRAASALSWPYAGPSGGRGPRRQDGRQGDSGNMPQPALQKTPVAGHSETRRAHAPWLPKACSPALPVVRIVQTHRRTPAQAHVSWCSRALPLASASLVADDGWRCQLELHCREAQQSWGLADFMTVTPTGVTNAAPLALCRVTVAYRLQANRRQRDPADSLLDLQAAGRGDKYGEATIHRLPEKPAPVLLGQILHQVACLGRIHAPQPSFSFS